MTTEGVDQPRLPGTLSQREKKRDGGKERQKRGKKREREKRGEGTKERGRLACINGARGEAAGKPTHTPTRPTSAIILVLSSHGTQGIAALRY